MEGDYRERVGTEEFEAAEPEEVSEEELLVGTPCPVCIETRQGLNEPLELNKYGELYCPSCAERERVREEECDSWQELGQTFYRLKGTR